EPGLVGRDQARPRPSAAALHLAAFHGEHHLAAARIAADDLHLGAEHAVENARELVGVGTHRGAADGDLLGEQVLELLDARGGVPRHAHAHLVVGAADPGELGAVELGALLAEDRIEPGAAADGGDHAAVLWGDAEHPVGEPQAAGAFHVLRHDRRIAGDVLGEVARDDAGVEVIATADAVADVEIERLALVEVGRALGAGDR